MTFVAELKRRIVAKGAENVNKKDAWLDNDDIRPLALKDRTWTQLTYFVFWISANASVANWYGGSAAQSAGLNMWEVLACTVVGDFLIAIVFVVNGRAGAVYHVGYPVLNRASFGIYGAWWPTFNRAVMATVWNGVNGVQGGQCVYTMLHAIFPGIARIPNTMGSGSAMTSASMIGYIIFWLATACSLVIPIPKMRPFVYIKLGVYIVSAACMLGWTMTLAGGAGPVISQPSTVHGTEKSWLMAKYIFINMGSSATFASNAADFQRYAKKPNDVLLGNIFGFPFAAFLVSIVGQLVASSSTLIFGELVWNPLDLLDRLQTENYTAKNRAGCFFIALMFAYSALFSSVFENSLPAGNDIAALFPKYISVRTGMFICQLVSLAINPWYLLGTASAFINFLASYQIFLSSITGVLICNYFMIARGYFNVPDLYSSRKSGVYHFWHGWNFRAYIAYVVAIAPNFPGFLGNMGVKMPLGITRFYYFAYPVGIAISFVVFWVCNLVWKPEMMMPLNEWHEPKNYIRPEEDTESGVIIEGNAVEDESDSGAKTSDEKMHVKEGIMTNL
ncbi:hypothetical protein A1O1_05681 [Capronia coronata CBS 617.96]|uniref:NCS1 family nucleobase:cation symporter-1 n=1 Tax=Capronia coronata CBS 617.96 TaxID=1182541 RepID=W9Z2K6_9EURO|nr:uncharacterized protein A1O1_05681 [Capronia coronata CBS 617.96]EXJ88749.1 hypothetical protein A1O1_05681 [Capronia coronata CBS 617.96]